MVEGVENGHVQLSDSKLIIHTPFNIFSKLEMNNETWIGSNRKRNLGFFTASNEPIKLHTDV